MHAYVIGAGAHSNLRHELCVLLHCLSCNHDPVMLWCYVLIMRFHFFSVLAALVSHACCLACPSLRRTETQALAQRPCCGTQPGNVHVKHTFWWQVRDLMVYLEAQQHIQGSSELSQGTVLPVPEAATTVKRKTSRSRKG